MPTTKLTHRGYTVRKDELTDAQLTAIRNDLRVTPLNPTKERLLQQRKQWYPNEDHTATDDEDSFNVYQENAAKLYLPPFYALATFGKPYTNTLLTRGAPTNLLFHGTLRPQQLDVADRTVAHLNAHGGGILQLRCGFGKTIIALHLFARLKLKTLVLVHKEFLMNQWRERIAQFLPDAKVGTLQAKVCDVDGRDIVLGMLQSVATGKYPPEAYTDFGVCCFDECHHLGAKMFSRAMSIGRTRYMLGLSATPDRKDGLRKVFDWHIGDVICKVEAKVTQRVVVDVVPFADPCVDKSPAGQVTVRTKTGTTIVYNDRNPTQRVKLLQHLVDSVARTDALMATVLPFANDPERRVLVLSERRKHLEALGERLTHAGIDHGYYWGGVKQALLDEAATKRVILGTYHMASEGMDIPVLNTVLLASPKSDVKQSVGRILRKTDHAVVPTVLDFVDTSLPCFARQLRVRKKFYAQCGFECDGVSLGVAPKEEKTRGAYLFRD